MTFTKIVIQFGDNPKLVIQGHNFKREEVQDWIDQFYREKSAAQQFQIDALTLGLKGTNDDLQGFITRANPGDAGSPG